MRFRVPLKIPFVQIVIYLAFFGLYFSKYTQNYFYCAEIMEPLKIASVENEYVKNKELRKEDVEALQEWIARQKHLPPIPELYVILFLQSCYFSIEQAKITIDNFFTMKTHCPDLFARRDPCTEHGREFMNICLFEPLPKLTPEGYKIILCKPMDPIGSHWVFTDQLKLLDMNIILWLHSQGSEEGMILLPDLEFFNLGHMARLHLPGMKKLFFYLQEALPVRMQAMHFVNPVQFMDTLLSIMKPFMKKGLTEKIYLHNSLESLYKYVPKDCLPSDYGGPFDSVSTLHAKNKERLIVNRQFYLDNEKQIVDESLREGKPKNASEIFGMEGSFKKLDID